MKKSRKKTKLPETVVVQSEVMDKQQAMDKRIYHWNMGGHQGARAFIFDGYGDTLDHYLRMVGEIRKDFLHIKDSDIILSTVKESSTMKNFAVVTFVVPPGTKHPAYSVYKDKMDFRY